MKMSGWLTGFNRSARWRSGPMLAVTVLAWLPAILVAIAIGVRGLTGCQVDEGNVHPCPVAGYDIGDLLNTFFVSGWLMLATLPFMMLTALIWAARAVFLVGRALMARRSPGRS